MPRAFDPPVGRVRPVGRGPPARRASKWVYALHICSHLLRRTPRLKSDAGALGFDAGGTGISPIPARNSCPPNEKAPEGRPPGLRAFRLMKVLPGVRRLKMEDAARQTAHCRHADRAKRNAAAGRDEPVRNEFYVPGCHALADLPDLRAFSPEPISGTAYADFRGHGALPSVWNRRTDPRGVNPAIRRTGAGHARKQFAPPHTISSHSHRQAGNPFHVRLPAEGDRPASVP